MGNTDGLYVPMLASVSTGGTPLLSICRTWQTGGEPPRDSARHRMVKTCYAGAVMVLSGSLHRKVRRIAAKLRNEQLREDLWTFQDHFQDHFDIEVGSCHLC